MRKLLGWFAVTSIVVATGCGSSSDTPPATTYTVGGTVTGLTGTGLVLRNNGGNDLPVAASGSFAFTTALTNGAAYAVTVAAQPTGQTCVVTNGTGTIAGANVTNVAVACVSGSYTVGGTVSGLSGSGLVLKNNGGDDLSVSGSGTFTFATPVAAGTAYAVTVSAQPANPTQSCVVTNGTGNGTSGNVTNVQVTCTTSTFTVGGTVAGLTGTGLQLLNKGGDALSVSANGAFTFVTPIASGDTYLVTVGTQPSGQVCTMSGGSGTVGGANVTSVTVTCSANTFTVAGTVAGLAGTGLQLSLNGGAGLAVTNGPFSFVTRVADGSPYTVTVAQQPTSPAQTCTVTNGTGTVNGANVTDVAVACTAPTYTIGGTVTGLTGTGLVLQNNAGNNLSVSASGAFTFTTALTTGSAYAVTVLTQPSGPTQNCVVTGGTGTVASANVTNVSVACTTSTFTVGGSVSGLTGTGLVLRNNGGDDLTRDATGAFTFATAVASGATYAVTVATQPSNPYQICTVTSGSGTIGAANVTNVAVNCVLPPQVIQSWTAPTSWGGTAAGFWADGESGMVQHLTFPSGTAHESGSASIAWNAPNGPPPMNSITGVGSLGVTRTGAGPFNDAAQAYVADANDGALDITGDMLVCAVVKPTWNLPDTGVYGENDQIIFAKGIRGNTGWVLLQALHFFSFRYQTVVAGEHVAYTSTDLVPENGTYHGPLNPTYVVVCAGRDVAGGAIRIVANGWNSSLETPVAANDPMYVAPIALPASVGGYAANDFTHDYGGRVYETAVWTIPATVANINAKMAPVLGLSMPSGTTVVQYTRDREAYYPGVAVSPTPQPYHTGWKHEPRIDPTGKGVLFGLQATNRVTIPEALQGWTPSVTPAPTVVANNDFPPGDARVENAALVTLPANSSISVPLNSFGNPGAIHGQVWLKSTDAAQRGTLTVSLTNSVTGGSYSEQDIGLPTLPSGWNHVQLTSLSIPAATTANLVFTNTANGASPIQFEAWGVVATQLGRDIAGVTTDVNALGFDPGPTIYNTLANPAIQTPREMMALPAVTETTAPTGFCIGAQGQPATGMSWEGNFLDRRTMVQWYASDTSFAKIMVMGQAGLHVFRFYVQNGLTSHAMDVTIPGSLGVGDVAWIRGCVATDGTMTLYNGNNVIGTEHVLTGAPDLIGGSLYVGADHTGTEPWHGYIQAAATCRNNGVIGNCH
jgi:hypothetical protein